MTAPARPAAVDVEPPPTLGGDATWAALVRVFTLVVSAGATAARWTGRGLASAYRAARSRARVSAHRAASAMRRRRTALYVLAGCSCFTGAAYTQWGVAAGLLVAGLSFLAMEHLGNDTDP